jgi:hypothetical protein
MPILELKADLFAMWRFLRTIRDYFSRGGRTSTNRAHPGIERPHACGVETEMKRVQTARLRLAEAVARLERLDAERDRRGDSRFGRTAENRIIWGELIELELQEIDEQVSRICNSTGCSAHASQPNPRGSYERDDA